MAGYHLRLAVASDTGGLVRLLHRSWETAWAPFVPAHVSERYYSHRVAEWFVETRRREIVVVEQSGRLVGLVHSEADFVSALHVDPDWKRRGIGSCLMDRAETDVARRGHATVRLNTDDFNEPAQRFYRHRGFSEARRFPDLAYEGEVMTVEMHKALVDARQEA